MQDISARIAAMSEPLEENESDDLDTMYWVINQINNSDPGLAERGMVQTLLNYRVEGIDAFGKHGALDIIGVAVEKPEKLYFESNPRGDYSVRLPDDAWIWGGKFIWEILKEIRKIICDERHGGVDLTDYKNYPKAVSVALAGVVMNAIGVKEPMALGIATLILMALGNATKNAFCTMTNESVIHALDPNAK